MLLQSKNALNSKAFFLFFNLQTKQIACKYSNNLNVLDSTINQIEHYFLINLLQNKRDALKLCQALQELVINLEIMVSRGKKSNEDNVPKDSFKLYHNDIIYTNNTILIESESHKILYYSFVSPDYLRTTDTRIVEYTKNWFEDIISKSNQISAQGEKIRKYFFGYLFQKISTLKQKIEMNGSN